MAKIKEQKTLADLTPDSRNLNKGTERGSGFIEKSLRNYGAGRSILADKHGNIVAGNKTAEACGAIGLDKIRVIESDGTELIVVKRMDLDINSKAGRELAIADNRAGQISLEWDVPQLELIAEEYGIDLGDIGFADGELTGLSGIPVGADGKEFDESIGESVKYCKCPKCGHDFPA